VGAGRRSILPAIRLDILRTSFRGPLLVMLFFHLAQYLAVPIFPLYFVNALHLTDEQIGIGTALFHMSVFLGSTQLVPVTRWLGHQKVSGFGAVGMSLYPILLSQASTPLHYYLLSAVGGFAWAMVGGAFANYLLDKIPPDDRPAYLAWYNIILNLAILVGSLAGPWLAGYTGLVYALLLFGFLRLLSGIAILRWG
jgi:predicted MFS family arabinose efflux permease